MASKYSATMFTEDGGKVTRNDIIIWDGPVPPNSYEFLCEGIRMSTPEFYLFRKCNTLPFHKAALLAMEMFGKYMTNAACQDIEAGEYEYLRTPRMSYDGFMDYLDGIDDCKEKRKAVKVADAVAENCPSPMSAALYLILCLPVRHGGYGIEQAETGCVFITEDGYAPAASGEYLAYDLAWPYHRLAVQYTGKKDPKPKDMEALSNGGFNVLTFWSKDFSADMLNLLAMAVAEGLGDYVVVPASEMGETWRKANAKLIKAVDPLGYKHQKLVFDDIRRH